MTAGLARLRGSIVPLVTPFRDGEVDLDAFERSVERQVREGSHGIVVTGTTGEPTSLTGRERAELTRRAVAAAAGRIPVVAATGSSNHAETIELTRAAEQAGADAVLVVCPPFVKPSQAGLVEHFTRVAAVTELPFLIYNIPGRAAVAVSAETVARVRERAPNLVGLKHASGELDLVTELLERLGEDFRLFCGLETYSYPFLAVGGAGLMSAVGNLLPARVAELCELVWEDDHDEALRTHRELFAVSRAVFFETNPVPLKLMLASVGLGNGEVRPPLTPASADTRRRLAPVTARLHALASGARDRAPYRAFATTGTARVDACDGPGSQREREKVHRA
jgi:4-hydroxy-tetrahydrodipicolinate synthase